MKKILIIILILMLVGCTKEKPKPPNTEYEDKLANEAKIVEKSLKSLSSTIVSKSYVSGLPEIVYEIEIEPRLQIQRIFILVDGQPSEFSLNGSKMAMYQDMQGDDFTSTKITVKPSVKGKKKGDTSVVTSYVVYMDDTLEFTDYLSSFYRADILGVNTEIELDSFNESGIVPREFEFTQTVVDKPDSGIQFMNQFMEVAQTSTILGIQTKDMFSNSSNGNGFMYDKDLEYYLAKIGVDDILVYPLLNGEYMTKDNQIISFYFPKSKEKDEMFYTSFELQEFNIKQGDIITLLTWNTETKQAESSPAHIAIEPQ